MIGLLWAISNSLLIQYGQGYSAYHTSIDFPISFKTMAKCVIEQVNDGYVYCNIVEVTTSSVTATVRGSSGEKRPNNIMFLAMGY